MATPCPLSPPSSWPFSPARAQGEASQRGVGIPAGPVALGAPGCLPLAERTQLLGQQERAWSAPRDPAPAPGGLSPRIALVFVMSLSPPWPFCPLS